MKGSRSDLDLWFWIVTIAGALGFLYAFIEAHWDKPITLVMLSVLLIVVEMFPVEVDRIGFSLAFPIVYTFAVVSSFSAAAIVSGTLVAITRLLLKRPLSSAAFHAATRVCAVLIAGCSAQTLAWFHLHPNEFLRYWFIHVAVTTIVMTAISHLGKFFFFSPRTPKHRLVRILSKATFFTVVGTFLYDGFMIWLASNPKNTGSGSLGTLFYFLPLVAATIVVHLISNLTRAKSGLEQLVRVSESINHQSDLPTVLEQIVQAANQLVKGNCGFLFVVQEDGSLTRKVGTISDDSAEFHLNPGMGLAGCSAQTGEAILVENTARDSRFVLSEATPGTQSLLVVPIHINEKVAGVISLGNKYTYGFRQSDLNMMNIFATGAGVAMKNALYIEEREKRLLVEERNRLAREIHDGIAQDLASIVLLVESVKRNYSNESARSISQIQDLLKTTVSTVRQSIYALRPQPYTHVGLVPALRSMLEEVSVESGIKTHLRIDPEPLDPLAPDIAQVIYDTVSESLQNVIKHAEANQVWVDMNVAKAAVVVQIRDDGKGFHFGRAMLLAVERQSYGIENLHRLATEVGGSLDYVTSPGEGTTVLLEIPLEECLSDDNSRVAL